MNTRIDQIKKSIAFYNTNKEGGCATIRTAVSPEVYSEVEDWLSSTHEREFANIRSRQQAKFNRLICAKRNNDEDLPIVEVSKEDQVALKQKWVVNISDRSLDAYETSLLQHGLNYAVTPSVFPTDDYIVAVESACKHIGADSEQAASLRADCVKILKRAPLPRHNVSRREREALKRLKDESDIMILPADKGRAVVVMNTIGTPCHHVGSSQKV